MEKRRFGFKAFLVLLFLFGILIIPDRAEAASYQKVYDKIKIAGKYFWEADGNIMVSKTEDDEGKCIQKDVSFFITNGKIIYFVKGYEQDAINLYRINADGTDEKRIKKLKHGGSLSGFYGNQLYYERHGQYEYDNECDYTEIHEYSYNLKTGKIKKVVDNCCFRDSYKQYFIGRPNSGSYDPLPLILYNARTEKTTIITQGDMGAYIQKNKIYFTDAVKKKDGYIYADGTWKVSIKSYDLKTKRTKVLVKKMKIQGVYKIDSKEVIYNTYDKQGESQYYSYNYKTGKKRKITRESIM